MHRCGWSRSAAASLRAALPGRRRPRFAARRSACTSTVAVTGHGAAPAGSADCSDAVAPQRSLVPAVCAAPLFLMPSAPRFGFLMASQLIPESSVEAAFPSVGFFVASLFIAESSFGARRPGNNIAQLQRVTIPERLEDGWFTENYRCLEVDQKYGTLLDDVDVVFHISEVSKWRTMSQRRKKKNP